MATDTNMNKSWRLYFILAISYVLSGQLMAGLTSQTQIVLIWLPAGIALVGCYLWWWRFIPAVFVASIVFNYFNHPSAYPANISTELILELTTIATGASLQAFIGSALLRYWIGDPLRLASDFKGFAFIFIVGILLNLISANIGAFALSQFNPMFAPEQHWNNVLNWWLSDSLGVLLATPFILSLLQLRQKEQQNKPHLIILSTTCLLFVIVTVTTLFFSKIRFENAHSLAQRELKVVENSMHRQLNNTVINLQALAGYIQSSNKINRQTFKKYAYELIKNQPSIKALSWNPIIKQSDLSQFEDLMSKIYFHQIKVKGQPLHPDDPMVIVKFITPEIGNEKAVAFNVFSNYQRKEALLKATLQQIPRATSIIQLVQSEQDEPAYLLFLPVYKLNPDVNNNSYKQLIGFATGVILAQKIIDLALAETQKDMFNYELFENNRNKAFASNTRSKQMTLNKQNKYNPLVFKFNGQVWNMNLEPKQVFLDQYQTYLAFIVFAFQLVVVSFTMLLILLMNNRHTVLNNMVKQRTADLNQAKLKSDKSNLAKSKFLANMSNEIRTPLNAVIGFTQLAKKPEESKQLLTYIDKIELATKTLVNIVNDILDISSIETDKLRLKHKVFDMHALVARIQVMFEIRSKDSNVSWSVKDTLPSDISFIGDQARIEQILISLCANAFKYTHSGNIDLKIKIANRDQNVAQVCFTIIDTGAGLDQEAQDNLFDAYTHFDTSGDHRFINTGLGLNLAKELSVLMGGDIQIKSELAKGTEVTFIVPLDISEQTARQQKIKNQFDLAGLTILVAEDNVMNQILIEALLDSMDIKSVIVFDGYEVLEALEKREYDIILMDCQMPNLNGYDTTTKIRQNPDYREIPIIALTADVTPDDKLRAFEAGCNAHVSKPIDVNKLRDCLESFNK